MIPRYRCTSDEWLQQRDHEEWERICSMSPAQIDAELIAMGYDPDELSKRIMTKVNEALDKKRKEIEDSTKED